MRHWDCTPPLIGASYGSELAAAARVEACWLCHADIHAAHGEWRVKPHPPFIPGHEGVGRVVELGSAAVGVTLGQRVALPWLGYACGTCDYCVSGRETLCESQQNTGYSIDGAFGEFAAADSRYVVAVPDGIDPIDAAPLTCAGVTTYKAVKVAGPRSSDLVAVFGIGGLRHLAIQYARIAGGRVIALDVIDEKLELARELGAEFTVNATEIVGSIVGTRQDLREVFELHAAGLTKVISETRPLDHVNQAIADVEAGRVPARIVLQP